MTDFYLPVKRLTETAILPTRGSEHAVGFDLYADKAGFLWSRDHNTSEESYWKYLAVKPNQRRRISTGIAMAIPVGYYGRIAPRSGLAHKYGIDTLAGVVDPDYRGEVHVIIQNLGDEDLQVKPGDRIAQIVFERVGIPQILEMDELDVSLRGISGYGSTGR